MEKTLRQDEIDALFEAARATSVEPGSSEVRARVVPYNFSSSGQISTDQLRKAWRTWHFPATECHPELTPDFGGNASGSATPTHFVSLVAR